MMQVSKDTPDELEALTTQATRARCKACAEEAAQGEGQCSEDGMQWPVEDLGPAHRLYEPLKFI